MTVFHPYTFCHNGLKYLKYYVIVHMLKSHYGIKQLTLIEKNS